MFPVPFKKPFTLSLIHLLAVFTVLFWGENCQGLHLGDLKAGYSHVYKLVIGTGVWSLFVAF